MPKDPKPINKDPDNVATVTELPDGRRLVERPNRPPRIYPAPVTPRVVIPDDPKAP